MRRAGDRAERFGRRLASCVTPVMALGMTLVVLGVLVVLVPQILVAMIAILFIALGMLLIAHGRERHDAFLVHHPPTRVRIREILYHMWHPR